jgi:hypothetical protein
MLERLIDPATRAEQHATFPVRIGKSGSRRMAIAHPERAIDGPAAAFVSAIS